VGQFVLGVDVTVVPGVSVARVHALYGSPDNLGLLLDRVIPLWLASMVLIPLPPWPRLAGWVVGGVLAATLILTFSRGAWLAVGVGCYFALAVRLRHARPMLVAAAVLAVVVVGFESSRVASALASGHSHTVERRVDVWSSSLRMLRTRPLFGVGPDNFLHYYAPTRQQDPYNYGCEPGLGYMQAGAGDEPCLSHPHNEVLDFWLSTGVLGLGAFLWIEVQFWRVGVEIWCRARVPDGLLLGCMAAMLAALVHGLVDNVYFLTDLAVIFWLLCGYMSWRRSTLQP
jgi:O-antigen ligase